MKAVIQRTYGPPEALTLDEVPKPTPGDDDVLVRVHASSINAMDRYGVRGWPLLARPMMGGTFAPKDTSVGTDLAGEVEAVGRNVKELRPGDAVFGTRSGAFADYVCAKERTLAPKPANVTFEEAAAVPIAALTALQGLRDVARVRAGQGVLVNRASGGVGSFAVQIAKALGAHVTAVCGPRSVELARRMGADIVIDHTKEDFTRAAGRYDVMFDVAGDRPLVDCARVVDDAGTIVVVGAPSGRWVGPIRRAFVMPKLLRRFVKPRLAFFIAQVRRADLLVLAEMLETKKVVPVIDRTFPLREFAEAFRYFEKGHPTGKVVIRV